MDNEISTRNANFCKEIRMNPQLEKELDNLAFTKDAPPVPRIRLAGGHNDFREKIFRCNINVTDLCNQKCSYCINADTHKRHRRVLDPLVLEQFIEDVAERVTDKSFFTVAGGEPFLYPHLELLVKKLASTIQGSYTQLRFLTNGSLLPEKALPLYEIKGKLDLQYVVSVHMEFMNLDKFIARVQDFEYRDDVLCKILMAPGQMKTAEKTLEKLKEAGFKVYLNAVTGTGRNYSEAEKDFLHSHTNIFVPIDLAYLFEDGSTASKSDADMVFRKEYFDFKGMACGAGITSLRLGPDGQLLPCFGLHSIPKDKRPDYNLAQKRLRDMPELNRPMICPSTYCFCSPFLSAPKWRNASERPIWLEEERN